MKAIKQNVIIRTDKNIIYISKMAAVETTSVSR